MKKPLLLLLSLSSLVSISASADVLVAKIQPIKLVYAKRPVTLDGSGSSQGAGVTYQWAETGATRLPGAPPEFPVENADKPVAQFTPPYWGVYNFSLTVSQGADRQVAKASVHVINDPARDDSPVYEGEKKVLYKQAPDALGGVASMYLHIFNPDGWKATDKRPVVLLFHGGGWSGGSPDRYVDDAKYWASRGLVGISGQYRLGGREGTPPPACVADAKSAVRYLRSHAAELGIDPQKIAVGGESAGAHIAAAAGTLPAYNDPKDDLSVSCVPNALLLYFPFSMVTPIGNRKDDMSPLHFVTPSTPPTLFIAGEMDGIAPAERGIDWGNQMKGGANQFSLFIYRRAHHPSGIHDPRRPGVDNDIIRQTDIFLASLGYLSGQPTIPPMDAEAIAKLHVDPKDFKPLPPKASPPPKGSPPDGGNR